MADETFERILRSKETSLINTISLINNIYRIHSVGEIITMLISTPKFQLHLCA